MTPEGDFSLSGGSQVRFRNFADRAQVLETPKPGLENERGTYSHDPFGSSGGIGAKSARVAGMSPQALSHKFAKLGCCLAGPQVG